MFTLRDFVSLACLTNTPYPNDVATAVLGLNHRDLKQVVIKNFETSSREQLISSMRVFVAMYVGPVNSDLGYLIRELMWDWCKKHDKRPPDQGVNSGEVEDLRKQIYGPCKEGGRDYNDYQPCKPLPYSPITTIEEFNKEFKEAGGPNWSDDKEDKWNETRGHLADLWQRMVNGRNHKPWPYIVHAMAQEFKVSDRLMAGGLKKEF